MTIEMTPKGETFFDGMKAAEDGKENTPDKFGVEKKLHQAWSDGWMRQKILDQEKKSVKESFDEAVDAYASKDW